MERFVSVTRRAFPEEPGDAADERRAVSTVPEAAGEEAALGGSGLPFFDRRRAVAAEEPKEVDGDEKDGDEEDGESVSAGIEPPPSYSVLDDAPTVLADAERELREASDELVGDARPYPRDDPATRDWFLAEDRSRAVAAAERARAAVTEAARFPAYAAVDPEVVTGALRELRVTGRWRDPRTLRHGTSDVGVGRGRGRGRGRGGRSWR